MHDIAMIVNSDDMMQVARAVVARTGSELLLVASHTYDETLAIARRLESEGYRMLIARGGHAARLRADELSIPITSIPFTGNNVASLLLQARRDWGEFAVVGNPTLIQMARELESGIGALCIDGLLTDILVLEEDLEEVRTYSVGQVRLPDRTISYFGTQVLTPDNEGAPAYGGSSLFVVRGGFDALLARPMPAESREAVERAIAFDRLADRHIAGLIASRRNYDVACGVAGDGNRRIGVLEQSWRIGGATPAEIAALEALAREPQVQAVRARSVEVYGHPPALPEGAAVYYRGHDPKMGPLTKYACVDERIEG